MVKNNELLGSSKDQFLQQARDARQARELAQAKDKAATKIQAFFRSSQTRSNLKSSILKDLKNQLLIEPPCETNSFRKVDLVRKIITFCKPDKDKDLMLDLLRLISSNIHKDSPDNKYPETICSKVVSSQDARLHDVSNETKELTNDNMKYNKYFDTVILEQTLSDPDKLLSNLKLIETIVNYCLDLVCLTKKDTKNLEIFDLTLNCLNIIRTFTTYDSSYKDEIQDQNVFEQDPDCLTKLINEIASRTLLKKVNLIEDLSFIIIEFRKMLRKEDLKTNGIIYNFTKITLSIFDLNKALCQTTTKPHNNKEQAEKSYWLKKFVLNLTQFLCQPAMIKIIHDSSKKSLELLNQSGLFLTSLSVLSCHFDMIQDIRSTSALCLLANMIHSSSLNDLILNQYLLDFCLLMNKILMLCKKDCVQSGAQSSSVFMDMNNNNKVAKRKSQIMKRGAKDVTYNQILGWLERDKDIKIDRELIISQLSNLWSPRFIRILSNDLMEANSNNDLILSQGESTSNNKQANSIYMFSSKNVELVPSDCGSQTSNDQSSGTSILPFGLWRRVSRWKGQKTSFIGGTGNGLLNLTRPGFFGGLGPASKCKTFTPESCRIGAICKLIHSSMDILVTVRQDILASIFSHDHILLDLWVFIKSLGPNNGLNAFLELLPLLIRREPIPEFQLLLFFCESTSHLINILDDSELYEIQKPFKHQDLLDISSFLNNYIYQVICYTPTNPNESKSELTSVLEIPHRLLKDLYTRDCRRRFAPKSHWVIKELRVSSFLKDIESKKPTAFKILQMLPHIIPHKERVQIFRKFVSMDKLVARPSTLISIHRSRLVEDGYQQLARLSNDALKGLIRVKFINDFGLGEAGIDQDGVFKEFLEDTMKRVFDPALNLFKTTSEQCLYPSPTSRLHEDHLSLFKFVGKMLAKGVYEGIMVDVPFALFFLSRVVGHQQTALYSPLDELPSLDPELYKSLTYIKHYEGDVSELNLTFSIDQDFMGRIETIDLEPGGKSIPVTRENRVRYIHSVANFHMRTQIEKQTEAFIQGFRSIIDPCWLSMFSAKDLQNLISGENTPIDLCDLRKHTKYSGGFHNNHRVISWLWDILEKDFTAEEHKLFLKFVTSCSKPPLLGFSNLEPPFSIRCIEVSDDQDIGDTIGSIVRGFLAIRHSDPVDRLPSSSTCFNLLKLPNYQKRSTLKEKLRYAIHSNAGFELS